MDYMDRFADLVGKIQSFRKRLNDEDISYDPTKPTGDDNNPARTYAEALIRSGFSTAGDLVSLLNSAKVYTSKCPIVDRMRKDCYSRIGVLERRIERMGFFEEAFEKTFGGRYYTVLKPIINKKGY